MPNNATEFRLNKVRLSFPKLWVAEAHPKSPDRKRYGANFLIVPGSENDKIIQAGIRAAAEEKWPKNYNAKLESFKGSSNQFCYVRGDAKDYDGYQGMLILAAHRQEKDGRPLVIDGRKNPLSEKDGKPYAGCYVNASVSIWAQDGDTPGIRCTLRGVQFDSDGDAFSGASVANQDDFSLVEGAEGNEPDAPAGGETSLI